jgi:cytochrome c biogenesis factor
MFFGFVTSSEYDGTQTVSLPQGAPVETLGYRLTYEGYAVLQGDRYSFSVRVEKDGRSFRLAPVMYHSTYNEGIMRHPDIANLILKDFYLAPLALEEPGAQGGASGVTVDTLIVEASVKPLINLVWTGVIILLVGFGVTVVRRAGEVRTRGSKRGILRSGADADAEQIHELAAEPGSGPEEGEGSPEEQQIHSR